MGLGKRLRWRCTFAVVEMVTVLVGPMAMILPCVPLVLAVLMSRKICLGLLESGGLGLLHGCAGLFCMLP